MQDDDDTGQEAGAGNGAGAAGNNPLGGAGGSSGEDLDALIARSPFGRLLDLPGIDGAEDIFGNAGGGGAGGNPFGGGGGGSSPGAGDEPMPGGGPGDGDMGGAAGDYEYDFNAFDEDRGSYVYDFSAFMMPNDGPVRRGDQPVSGGTATADGAPGADAPEPVGGDRDEMLTFSDSGDTVTVAGGNNRFVIEFNGSSSGEGGRTVHVEGGNNQFVIVFDEGSSSDDADGFAFSGESPEQSTSAQDADAFIA